MAELTTRFKIEAAERTAAIAGLVAELETSADRAVACDAIRDHAHKIKGAAGVFGFDELKARAAALEESAASGAPDAELAAAAGGLKAALPE